MSYYFIPTAGYLGIASLLCLSFCAIECAKKKTRNTETSSILLSWVITSILVGSFLTYGTLTVRFNPLYLIIAILLCCITLVISGSLVYYS